MRSSRSAGITPAGVAAAVLVVVIATICIRLGIWQLDRLEQRRELNAAIISARAFPPAKLDDTFLDSLAARPATFEHRRAIAQGTFLPEGEILLRGRAFQGRPGVHLLAPFRLESGRLLLVNRGWLPAPDGATADPRPYRNTDPVALEGTLHLVPGAGAELVAAPLSIDDTTVMSYLRIDRSLLPEDQLAPPLYFQVMGGAEGASIPVLPIPVPPPDLDEGPHLGYAIQWFSFAMIAVVGFIVTVVVRRSRALG